MIKIDAVKLLEFVSLNSDKLFEEKDFDNQYDRIVAEGIHLAYDIIKDKIYNMIEDVAAISSEVRDEVERNVVERLLETKHLPVYINTGNQICIDEVRDYTKGIEIYSEANGDLLVGEYIVWDASGDYGCDTPEQCIEKCEFDLIRDVIT